MTDFQLAALLISLAALFGCLNHRLLRLPQTIGVMSVALIASLLLLIFGTVTSSGVVSGLRDVLQRVDLRHLVLDVLLGFLLFAGALHVNLDDLLDRRLAITSFATVSLLVSTLLVGTATFFLLQVLGLPLSYLHCLLFGALISPTDPVAVLGVMRRAGAPRTLQAKVIGESLFNDGLGVVIFLSLLGLAAAHPGAAAAEGEAASGAVDFSQLPPELKVAALAERLEAAEADAAPAAATDESDASAQAAGPVEPDAEAGAEAAPEAAEERRRSPA